MSARTKIRAIERSNSMNDPDTLREKLTPRELEIVRMVANGLTNKEIALTLEISHWTVATHLRRVYSKLKVNRRAALSQALLATSDKLVEMPKFMRNAGEKARLPYRILRKA